MNRLPRLAVLILLSFVPRPEATADEPRPTAPELIQRAAKFQNAGAFEKALPQWQQLLKEYPNDPAAWLAFQGVGTCSVELGSYPAAISAFDHALRRLPAGESGWGSRWNRAVARSRLAEATKASKDLEQAATELLQICDDPATPKERLPVALLYLGRAERALRHSAKAQEFYSRAVECGDRVSAGHALLGLAELIEETATPAKAVTAYRRLLNEHPEHAVADTARLKLAELLLRTEQLAEAEDLFGQLHKKLDGTDKEYAAYRWGELASLRGRADDAVARLTTFLKHYPKSGYRLPALLLIGDAELDRNRPAEAVGWYRHAVDDFPDDGDVPRTKVRLARAQQLAKQPADAERTLLGIPPTRVGNELRAEALLIAARCAVDRDKLADGLERYRDCFAIKTELPDADQVKAEAVNAALTAKALPQALTWADELIKSKPKSLPSAEAQLAVARALAESGETEAALVRCRRVLDAKHAPLRPDALNLAGFCATKIRQFDAAVGYFRTLEEESPKAPSVPAAVFGMAVAQEGRGATEQAIAAYQRLLKEYPDNDLATQARVRLRLLRSPP